MNGCTTAKASRYSAAAPAVASSRVNTPASWAGHSEKMTPSSPIGTTARVAVSHPAARARSGCPAPRFCPTSALAARPKPTAIM